MKLESLLYNLFKIILCITILVVYMYIYSNEIFQVETIKQHNKLFTVEAMFLHDYLEVPVSREMYEAVTGSSNSSSAAQTEVSDR